MLDSVQNQTQFISLFYKRKVPSYVAKRQSTTTTANYCARKLPTQITQSGLKKTTLDKPQGYLTDSGTCLKTSLWLCAYLFLR